MLRSGIRPRGDMGRRYLRVVGLEMIEAGWLCGGCWNMVCPNSLGQKSLVRQQLDRQRSMDGMRVRTDYILSSVQFQLVKVKYDFAMRIGLDHQWVHRTKNIPFCRKRLRKQYGFK